MHGKGRETAEGHMPCLLFFSFSSFRNSLFVTQQGNVRNHLSTYLPTWLHSIQAYPKTNTCRLALLDLGGKKKKPGSLAGAGLADWVCCARRAGFRFGARLSHIPLHIPILRLSPFFLFSCFLDRLDCFVLGIVP